MQYWEIGYVYKYVAYQIKFQKGGHFEIHTYFAKYVWRKAADSMNHSETVIDNTT